MWRGGLRLRFYTPLGCEIRRTGVADAVKGGGRPHPGRRLGKPSPEPAQSETLCTRGNSQHGKRACRLVGPFGPTPSP
jgi:hypothetical protein